MPPVSNAFEDYTRYKTTKQKRKMTNSFCGSVTLLMFIQALHSSQPAGRIGDFGNFF